MSHDEKEEKKVEQEVVQCKEEEKDQKDSNEVIDDGLTKENVLEMIRKLVGVQEVGNSIS